VMEILQRRRLAANDFADLSGNHGSSISARDTDWIRIALI